MRSLSESSPGSIACIHAIGLLFSLASIAWIPNITNPLHNGFGGSYQFLTIIALTMTTMTFGVGLLGDLSQNKTMLALKAGFSVCATPLEVLVGTLYWGLYVIDKSLVVPPGHALPFIPDLGFHAVPAIMLTFDMLAGPIWSFDVSKVMVLDLVAIFSYWSWLEYCYSINGWYPYPLLMRVSSWQKFVLCLSSAGLMTSNTMFLKWLHRKILKDNVKKQD